MNKEEILTQTKEILFDKIKKIERLISETRASNNETKSSMGDKYETSREMLQQEINQLQIQLKELLKSQEILMKITTKSHQMVGSGSLVETEMGWFYIAISLGEILHQGKKIFVISSDSPLAKAMLGKKNKEQYMMNHSLQNIKNIW